MNKKNIIFHPLIIALYPAIALYLQNINNVHFQNTISSFVLITIASFVLWYGALRLSKSLGKAALITSVFFLLFFSYGHVMTALGNYLMVFLGMDRHVVIGLHTRSAMLTLLAIWFLLFAAILFFTWRARSDFNLVTKFMNAVSLALMILAIFQALRIVTENQRIVQNFKSLQTIQFDIPSVPKNNTLVQPNVYYIVLDSYLRSDVMREIYDYDNTEFINFLHQKGFYVADQAHSNYGFTYLSLNASLNYDYLTSFSKQFEKRDPNLLPLVALLRNNRVMRFFKEQGYETVLFPSGYHAVENMKADVRLFLPNTLNSFQDELIAKTPLRFGLQQLQYELQRQRITYQFKNLPAAAEGNAPRFIFAHIIAPHPPFVFQADGSPFNPDWEFMLNDGDAFTQWIGIDQYIKGYHNQAIYTTAQAEILIEHLLALDPQPIIIIQADHGSGSQLDGTSLAKTNVRERFSILNSYYFPDQRYDQLYPSITPVNSFRVILNQYFGTHYDMLEDRSYWTDREYPYDPVEITSSLR